MKNITVSVPDDVYRAARITAAEKGTSVSALVRDYLSSMPPEKSEEFLRLERKQSAALERIRRTSPGFSSHENLTREQLYDRGLR